MMQAISWCKQSQMKSGLWIRVSPVLLIAYVGALSGLCWQNGLSAAPYKITFAAPTPRSSEPIWCIPLAKWFCSTGGAEGSKSISELIILFFFSFFFDRACLKQHSWSVAVRQCMTFTRGKLWIFCFLLASSESNVKLKLHIRVDMFNGTDANRDALCWIHIRSKDIYSDIVFTPVQRRSMWLRIRINYIVIMVD